MKARQIAIAVHSVYALDLQQRIHAIERRSDGLWGPWQGTGAEALHIVHEGDIVARIGLDGRISALQRSPLARWQDLELEANTLTAARLPDGAPVLFASDGDNLVWHAWKPTPDSPWTPWESLAGFAVDLRATVIPKGGSSSLAFRTAPSTTGGRTSPAAPGGTGHRSRTCPVDLGRSK